jgi:superfamily I DNA/RNA helicase
MAQANYMLDGIAAEMKSTGQFFERYNQPSLGQRVRDAISSWNFLHTHDGHEISLRDAQNLYRHISSGEGKLQRGAKKMLDGANDQDMFSLSVLKEHFGLQVPDTTWDVALDRIRDEDRAYITALLNRGVDIFRKPKIKLSTIHGSKGGEADNVLLYLDLSGKALQEMERNPDDAYRVLYVGITRTKENLVLKMPEDQQRGWSI